jgi:hypothetical protein
MSDSTLSRRISEFAGVALFAMALIWLIALVTYEPTDPVWFFTTDAAHPPANFVGSIGASRLMPPTRRRSARRCCSAARAPS